MTFREAADAFNVADDIEDAARAAAARMGIELHRVGGELHGPCPLRCGGAGHDRFFVLTHAKNGRPLATCRVCGESADALALRHVAAHGRMPSPGDLGRLLRERGLLDDSAHIPFSRPRPKSCEAARPAPDPAPLPRYAAQRARCRRAFHRFGLWMQNDADAARKAAAAVHLDADGLVLLGGGTEPCGRGPDGNDPEGLDFLVPFQDAAGRVSGIKFRRSGGYVRGGRRVKAVLAANAGPWRCAQGLFGLDRLELARLAGHDVLVVEGEGDVTYAVAALILEHVRDVTVIGLAYGCGQTLTPWTRDVAGLRVLVALDGDAPGRRASARRSLELLDHASSVIAAVPVASQDLRDLLSSGGTVREFLDQIRGLRRLTERDRAQIEAIR